MNVSTVTMIVWAGWMDWHTDSSRGEAEFRWPYLVVGGVLFHICTAGSVHGVKLLLLSMWNKDKGCVFTAAYRGLCMCEGNAQYIYVCVRLAKHYLFFFFTHLWYFHVNIWVFCCSLSTILIPTVQNGLTRSNVIYCCMVWNKQKIILTNNVLLLTFKKLQV